MPVASKVIPGSLAESSLARSRSSARSNAPSSRLTVSRSPCLAAVSQSRIRPSSRSR